MFYYWSESREGHLWLRTNSSEVSMRMYCLISPVESDNKLLAAPFQGKRQLCCAQLRKVASTVTAGWMRLRSFGKWVKT